MDVVGLSFELLSALFLVAVVAGFLDTLAGGGGLITMPALILSGVPPLAALGTNKLQGSMGTATATFMMFKKRKITWQHVKPLMISAFIGAVLGTIAVQFVRADVLTFVIPLVLLCIAIFFLVSPLLSVNQQAPRLSGEQYQKTVIPVIGFYDGMFGPGTGSFFSLAGVYCRCQDLINATAIAKPLNFSTNIASVVVFIIAGQVVWSIGAVMMAGQAIGAWLGAHSLFKINPDYLRMLVVLMCSGMLVKYADAMAWIDVF